MKLLAERALLPNGWAERVLIETDAGGRIVSVTPETQREPGMESVRGFTVPGMPNVHSHAFQRAMAGLTELRLHTSDSFWTWRDTMYRFAAKIDPTQMQAIATHLYVEMLKAGFTSVAEFHYLHHDMSGKPYADRAEMSHRLIASARVAGIAITHLPVLYGYGGFGAQPPTEGQRRFVNSADNFVALLESLDIQYRDSPNVRLGAAFHSLRAVDASMMRNVQDALARLDPTAPLHIHVAEQMNEVEECTRWTGQRPLEWLLDNIMVDERWCIVHATHIEDREVLRLANSGAVAGLCPTTEANLGDGVFPAPGFLSASGRFGIGTDSHVVVSVVEELRLLEYGQRLMGHQRAILASDDEPSPGRRMHVAATAGGARALGIHAGRIMPGCRADLVALDSDHRVFWNTEPAKILDAWIFSGDLKCVRDVMVGGHWHIRDGRHALDDDIAAACRSALTTLLLSL